MCDSKCVHARWGMVGDTPICLFTAALGDCAKHLIHLILSEATVWREHAVVLEGHQRAAWLLAAHEQKRPSDLFCLTGGMNPRKDERK